MKNWFNSLTPKVKGIVTIIILAVSIVVLWFAVKEIRKAIRKSKEKKKPQEVVNSSNTEYNDFVNAGETLSKPVSAYQGTANTIQQLLNGCETFSSELSVVSDIIKVVKKPIDFAFLIKEFGVREISDCGSFGYSDTQYDLISLLKDQLDSSGVYTLNIDGYNKSGFTFESLAILSTYLKTINITL